MSITTGGRRYLAWLGTESGYRPLRSDLGTVTGYTEISRHRRREVVQITLGTGNETRDALRAALADRDMAYATITEIPFDIELAGSGSARNMFRDCRTLTHVPGMDTSNVTDMRSMFNGCRTLTHVPDMDTSNVTDMGYMFQNCSALTHVPDMDTSNVTNMGYMFRNCSSLTDGSVRLIGKHPNVNTVNMITGSGLTREPFFDINGNPI